MIPGHLPVLQNSTDFSLFLLSDEQNVDVFARIGSPSVPVTVNVTIPAGVTISSAASANPAISFNGFASGSSANLHVDGTLIGAGGAGADGSQGSSTAPTFWGFYGGGGGGGFGNVGGVGGDGVTSASGDGTPGSNGTAVDPLVGGVAGVSATGATGLAFDQIYAAEDGGECIEALGYYPSGSFSLVVTGTGNILPGGGGGAGGYWDPSNGALNPTDGGASGLPGGSNPLGPSMLPGDGGSYLARSNSGGFSISFLFTGTAYGLTQKFINS